MTLGTHAIVGASIASLIPSHPIVAFCLGFGSHFLLDAIPHYDYLPRSLQKNDNDRMDTDMKINGKDFILDLITIAFDVFLGVAVALLVFFHSKHILPTLLAGAAGGILPDALQFVYFKFKREPLVSLQHFHVNVMHAKSDLNSRPILGLFYQVLLVFIVVAVVIFINRLL